MIKKVFFFFTSMQKEKASHATLLTGSLLAALLAIWSALTLAVYESLAIRAAVASSSDICRTSATFLKRTERTEESSLSVPELFEALLLPSGRRNGTNVGSL